MRGSGECLRRSAARPGAGDRRRRQPERYAGRRPPDVSAYRSRTTCAEERSLWRSGFDAAPFFFPPEHAAVEVAFAVVRAETFHPPARNRVVRTDSHVDPPYTGNAGGCVPERVHQQLRIEIAMAELGRREEVIQNSRRFRHFDPLADVGEKTRALALDHPAIGRQTSILGTGVDMLASVEAAAPQGQEGLTRFTRARHIGLQVIPRIEAELRDLLELERLFDRHPVDPVFGKIVDGSAGTSADLFPAETFQPCQEMG